MSLDRYEVVVIGAGIHGAGIAQAASAAGYRTLVIERERAAAGTSSRSSKLIHGGLRYLANGQFSLVRECLRERELLLRIAPQLVRRIPFYVPVYPTSQYGPWKLRAGLSLYAALGGLSRDVRFQRVPDDEWGRLDGLRQEGLSHVFTYFDAQTDDVELTRAVLESAEDLGAQVECPATVVGARKQSSSYRVEYLTESGTKTCEAPVVINAGGPWIDKINQTCEPSLPPIPFDRVQGSHLVLPRRAGSGVYYAESPRDGRPVFFMPWRGQTLVGTTETPFVGVDPGAVQPTDGEVDYLLEAWRYFFPDDDLSPVSMFAGIRVLPNSNGSFGRRPRETRFVTDHRTRPRWLTVAGGKLTSYRRTALQALRRLQRSLPRPTPIANTAKIILEPVETADPDPT